MRRDKVGVSTRLRVGVPWHSPEGPSACENNGMAHELKKQKKSKERWTKQNMCEHIHNHWM